jgi:hypothetical protein
MAFSEGPRPSFVDELNRNRRAAKTEQTPLHTTTVRSEHTAKFARAPAASGDDWHAVPHPLQRDLTADAAARQLEALELGRAAGFQADETRRRLYQSPLAPPPRSLTMDPALQARARTG